MPHSPDSLWHSLGDFIRGLLATPRNAPPNFATVTTRISATGYSRDAEETAIRERIVAFCRGQLGEVYDFGAESPVNKEPGDAWDCSELTENAYRRAGLEYPDGSNYQRAHCRGRRVREPKPGDPFFFDPDGDGIGHTGIYAGDGVVIEARSGHGVRQVYRHEIEGHTRFAGWFRHPDFSYPLEERA